MIPRGRGPALSILSMHFWIILHQLREPSLIVAQRTAYARDQLQTIYDWNSGLHPVLMYKRTVIHDSCPITGYVRVQQGVLGSRPHFKDTPKEHIDVPQGIDQTDLLALFPTEDRPAIATLRVDLTSAHFGVNRVHAFVHVSDVICSEVLVNASASNDTEVVCDPGTAYNSQGPVISAVLAPGPSLQESAILRRVELRPVELIGEWQEVLGDFYLLPQELGSNDYSNIKLYIVFGHSTATAGQASLTDLTITTVPFFNVALNKIAVATEESNKANGYIDVPDSVITNGQTEEQDGELWFYVDTNIPPITITVDIDLQTAFYVCAAEVTWNRNGHISDWSIYLSQEASGEDSWTEVLRVRSETDPSPGSTDARWFVCFEAARRLRLTMHRTDNHVFMFTEIALHGYEMARYGMCLTKCRHGGRCMYASNPVCECVLKWGWRGPDCNDDIDECNISPGSTAALVPARLATTHADVAGDLGLTLPKAGCAEGSETMANCTNIPGSWLCGCNVGFYGVATEGEGNICQDINECQLTFNGGCHHKCFNSDGSFRCECDTGYQLAEDGFACNPHCAIPCQHGGVCTEPGKCTGCDSGWEGDQCQQVVCQIKVMVLNDFGMRVQREGCYHGGVCHGVHQCENCKFGWAGPFCDVNPHGIYPLYGCLLTALVMAPGLLYILCSQNWVPFRERGPGLVILNAFGGIAWLAGGPAVSNPNLYGIWLVQADEQPESSLWGLWLPYTFGFAIWFDCILIRMRNVTQTYVKGKMYLSTMLQVLLFQVPWVVASAATTDFTITLVLWLGVLFLYGVAFLLACVQLHPMASDLPDIRPNTYGGIAGLTLVFAKIMLRLVGFSYANPDGLIGFIIPCGSAAVVLVHFAWTNGPLIYLKLSKNSALLSKYEDDSSSSDTDSSEEEKEAEAKERWQIMKTKGMHNLRVSSENQARAQERGGFDGIKALISNLRDRSKGQTKEVAEPGAGSSSSSSSDDDTDASTSAKLEKPDGVSKSGNSRGRGTITNGDSPRSDGTRSSITTPSGSSAASGSRPSSGSLKQQEIEKRKNSTTLADLTGSGGRTAVPSSADEHSEPVVFMLPGNLGELDNTEQAELKAEVMKTLPDPESVTRIQLSAGSIIVEVFFYKQFAHHAAVLADKVKAGVHTVRFRGRDLSAELRVRDYRLGGGGKGRYGRRGGGRRGSRGSRGGARGSRWRGIRSASTATSIPTCAASLQQDGDSKTAELSKVLTKVAKVRSAATLFNTVRNAHTQLVQKHENSRQQVSDDSLSSSEDSDAPDEEFELLNTAVSKFEKMVGKSRDLPGYVPSFEGRLIADHGRLDNFGMDMMVKRMIVLKDDGNLPSDIGDDEGTPNSADDTKEDSDDSETLPTFPSMALPALSDGGGFAIATPSRLISSTANTPGTDMQKMQQRIDLMRQDTRNVDEEQDIIGFADYDFSEVEYRITILTSNRPGAGTDAKIWVDCHGDLGSTGKCFLKRTASTVPTTVTTMFQRGSKDIFKLKWPNLGKIQKLQIGHDNSGRHPGWMLDMVLIEDLSKMEIKRASLRWTFRCNRWFDKLDGDGLTVRWLLPLSPHGDAAANLGEASNAKSMPWESASNSSRASSAATPATVPAILGAVRAEASLGANHDSSEEETDDGQYSLNSGVYYSSENENAA